MPHAKLLHRAHKGAPCAMHTTPRVPLPPPGGRLRCGTASGTFEGGARGGLLAYGMSGGPPSRGNNP